MSAPSGAPSCSTSAPFVDVKLPAGTVDNLVKPENKEKLTTVLTYHVVPGMMDAAMIMEQINAGGGKAEMTTVQGEKLRPCGIMLFEQPAHSLMIQSLALFDQCFPLRFIRNALIVSTGP